MIQTLYPVDSRMAKKTPQQPKESEHPRFKGGVPAMKRRATLKLSLIKATLQEIRDQLALLDQLMIVAESRGAEELYLDGATKADIALEQLMLFRQKVERAVHDLRH